MVDHNYFNSIFHNIFKIKANITCPENLLSFLPSIILNNKNVYNFKNLKNKLKSIEKIDIFAIEDFIMYNQNIFDVIDIIIEIGDKNEMNIIDNKYFITLSEKLLKSNKKELFDPDFKENTLSNGVVSEIKGNDNLIIHYLNKWFAEIKNAELLRITLTPPSFFNSLFSPQKKIKKGLAHFLLGQYDDAQNCFLKNEKRIFCEIMTQKELSLNEELFNYVIDREEDLIYFCDICGRNFYNTCYCENLTEENSTEEQINNFLPFIDRLILSFILIIYIKKTKNNSFYPFLYHFLDFQNNYLNLVFNIEFIEIMKKLKTHSRKREFLSLKVVKMFIKMNRNCLEMINQFDKMIRIELLAKLYNLDQKKINRNYNDKNCLNENTSSICLKSLINDEIFGINLCYYTQKSLIQSIVPICKKISVNFKYKLFNSNENTEIVNSDNNIILCDTDDLLIFVKDCQKIDLILELNNQKMIISDENEILMSNFCVKTRKTKNDLYFIIKSKIPYRIYKLSKKIKCSESVNTSLISEIIDINISILQISNILHDKIFLFCLSVIQFDLRVTKRENIFLCVNDQIFEKDCYKEKIKIFFVPYKNKFSLKLVVGIKNQIAEKSNENIILFKRTIDLNADKQLLLSNK